MTETKLSLSVHETMVFRFFASLHTVILCITIGLSRIIARCQARMARYYGLILAVLKVLFPKKTTRTCFPIENIQFCEVWDPKIMKTKFWPKYPLGPLFCSPPQLLSWRHSMIWVRKTDHLRNTGPKRSPANNFSIIFIALMLFAGNGKCLLLNLPCH